MQYATAFTLVILTFFLPLHSHAQNCNHWAAKLESLEGHASVKRQHEDQWQATQIGATFCYGDILRITEFRAALRLENDTLVRLNEGSTIKFVAPKKSFWLELLSGAAHFISRTPKSFNVKAPYVNAAVEGTEFLLTHTDTQDTVAVFEGTVVASNQQGAVRLQSMQQTQTQAQTAPSPVITIQLHNSANWTLYYPPLLVNTTGLPADLQTNNLSGALTELQSPRFTSTVAAKNLTTSLALMTGRIHLASKSNQQALALDSDNSDAKALAVLMQLINGNPTAALKASTALTLQPEPSANAWLIHSYTQQAAFNLDAALAAAQTAMQMTSANPLARVRVAELAISIGNNPLAQNLLNTPISDPLYKPYADSLRALIALQNHQNRKARDILTQSIAENPNIALSQFALGLTYIRLNDVQQGREKIELAVALDPSSSLYRSYLGKAYATELRGAKAQEQFKLAMTLDPEDPTPWFYSALEQQSNNNFVGAIEHFQKSRTLNDGRAVYRSRMRLDQDNASRSANLGRLYQAINFDDKALDIATQTTQQTPDNYSGHRLLAQVYTNDPEHEQLRASERLQATLQQPLGAQQLPLGLSETGMLVVKGAGPADLGTSEYNALFTKEGLTGHVNILGGSRNTKAYDVRIGALLENVSLNLGRYQYTSDGFRKNNDVEYTLSNVLAQWQLSNHISLQAEISRREDEQGDLGMRFDLSNFSENLRETKKTDTYRLAAIVDTHKIGQFTLSASSREKQSTLFDRIDFGMFVMEADDSSDTESESIQGQYLYSQENYNFIAGVEASTFTNTTFSSLSTLPAENDEHYLRSYAYLNLSNDLLKGSLQTTIGIEAIDHDIKLDIGDGNGFIDYPQEEFTLPHLGASWQINHALKLSASHFKTLSLNSDIGPSLAPNHIAGFVQNFDYAKATTTENNAIKLNYAPSPSLNTGLSYIAQSIELPWIQPGLVTTIESFKYNNPLKAAYIHYLATDNLSFSLKASERTTKRDLDDNSSVRALSIPIQLKETAYTAVATYTLNNAISVSYEGIMKKQNHEAEDGSGLSASIKSSETFYVANLDTEIRLPKRMGTIKLSIKNLFDTHFSYADFNVFTSEPRIQKLIPERSLYGSIVFYY